MINTKQLIACLSALILIFSPAVKGQAAPPDGFKVTDLKMCREADEDRRPVGITSEFPAGTQNVYAWFSWANAKPRLEITARWYYTTENIPILDFPISLTRISDTGVVSLRMPAGKTFPAGAYRLDLEAEGKTGKSTTFTVLSVPPPS